MLTDEKLAYYKRCYTREGWADLHVSRRVMRDLIEEIERQRALIAAWEEDAEWSGRSVEWAGAVAGAGAVT